MSLAAQLDEKSARLSRMREQVAQAEKINLLGRLVGGVAHDLNNVLCTAANTFSLLQFGDHDAETHAMLRTGQNALDRGGRLVRQLLDYMHSGLHDAEHVFISQVINETRELLCHLVGPTIDVCVDVGEQIWPVIARPDAIQSVLLNLAANARDAMSQGGTLRIHAYNCRNGQQPPQLPSGEYVCLTVADTGCGMSADTLAKAGQLFFTTKRKGHGTGLGLYSAFELASASGGCVTIDSSAGCGTAIHIFLARSALSPPRFYPAATAIDNRLHGGATILLIHPYEAARNLLGDRLRSLNYEVIEVGCTAMAQGISIDTIQPDLVVSDVRDGQPSFGLALELRRKTPELPIIYLNGSSELISSKAEIVLWTPVCERLLARAVLEQLGRVPAVRLTSRALKAASQMRERLRNLVTRELFDVWYGLARAQDKLPKLDDLPELHGEISDNAYIVAKGGSSAMPSFRLVKVGAALNARLGRDMTGEVITSSTDDTIGSQEMVYKQCLKGQAYFNYAIFRLGEFGTQRFERLLLPVSSDGHDVTHLIGVATFEELTRQLA